MKKCLSAILSILLIFGASFSGIVAAQKITESVPAQGDAFTDSGNHWAKVSIDRWSQRGVIQGLADRQFQPDRNITRSEWAALINRIFQYQTEADIAFKDISAEKWYTKDVSIAVAAGYMRGYTDGTFHPNANISRQEAAVAVARILSLQGEKQESTFVDATDIASWALKAVEANTKANIIIGYKDNTFQPLKELTRGEAISILDRVFNHYGTWYDEAGSFGPVEGVETIAGSIIINQPGITLQNIEIAGDLIISKAVGEGDVFLKNITVHGKTYVYGGGEHSVHLENVVMLTVIVDKAAGTVRLVAKGDSIIQEVILLTGTTLETDHEAEINRVTLKEELPKDSRVILTGQFETVNIEAKSILVQIPQGTVDNMVINGAGTQVEANKEAAILSIILNAAASILGQGTVQNATINSTGVMLAQAPQNVIIGDNVADDINVNVGGQDVPVQTISQPATLPSTSGSSGSVNDDTGGGNGGNTGSETGGNTGDMYLPSDAGSYFYFGLNSDVFSVNESVYVTSPRDGVVYIAINSVNYDPVLLEEAVVAGVAKKVQVKAGVRTLIDKSGFNYDLGTAIIVMDNQGNFSYPRYITVLDDDTKPLEQKTFEMRGFLDREDFKFIFNRDIKLVEGKDLRTSVTLSTYSNPDFMPLSLDDKIYIYRNQIVVEPSIPFLGKGIQFKLAADTVESLDGAYQNVEYDTEIFNSLTKIEIVDPIPPISYSATMKIGTVFKFKVNQGDTVYFVWSNAASYHDTILEEIAAGRAFVFEIADNQADQTFEVNTAGLQAGEYRLFAQTGHSITVNLIE